MIIALSLIIILVVVDANVFNIVLGTVKHLIVAPFTDIHSTADCCNGINLIIALGADLIVAVATVLYIVPGTVYHLMVVPRTFI